MIVRTIAMGTVTCSARLEPGAITQSVAWVGRPIAAACTFITAAMGVADPVATPPPPMLRRFKRTIGPRGGPYRCVAISLYDAGLAQLDALVAAARQAGLANASRSALIRIALTRLDLDGVLAETEPAGKREYW